jgi:hypothetical protein
MSHKSETIGNIGVLTQLLQIFSTCPPFTPMQILEYFSSPREQCELSVYDLTACSENSYLKMSITAHITAYRGGGGCPFSMTCWTFLQPLADCGLHIAELHPHIRLSSVTDNCDIGKMNVACGSRLMGHSIAFGLACFKPARWKIRRWDNNNKIDLTGVWSTLKRIMFVSINGRWH